LASSSYALPLTSTTTRPLTSTANVLPLVPTTISERTRRYAGCLRAAALDAAVCSCAASLACPAR
jgi:hypothetical protein